MAMYTPNYFKFESREEKVAFMTRYSFATIVSTKEGRPIATQLPFIVVDSGDKLLLNAHFALANEQASYIQQSESLVIFSEPHAYISPSNYDKVESVPTWNYIAVHAYGYSKIIDEESAKMEQLEQMINFYEPRYLDQWNGLSDKFKKGMAKGIVAFELEVTELQGQKKLSQNKTDTERARIIERLEQSGDSSARDLAPFIKSGS